MNKKFNKDFMLFLTGQGMSSLGTLIQKYCVSLFVLSITDSSMIFATVMIVSSIPNIFIGPFGGVLGDALDKRKIMIVLDMISGGLLILSFVLFKFTGVNIWLLIILITILSIINAIYIPSANSAIPLLVDGEIVKANSLNTFVITLTNVLAPVISGFINGFITLEWIIMMNSVTFLVSAFIEYLMKLNENKEVNDKLTVNKVMEELKAGLNFVTKEDMIKNIVICSFLCNFIVIPIYTVTIPYLSKKICGFTDVQYGSLEASIMIGLLVGTLLVNVFSKKMKINRILSISILVIGVFITLLSGVIYLKNINVIFEVNKLFMLVCSICLIIGMCISVMSISLTSLIQTNVDSSILARVNSIVISLSTIAIPVGQFILGIVLSIVNLELLLIVMSLCMVAISMWNLKKCIS